MLFRLGFHRGEREREKNVKQLVNELATVVVVQRVTLTVTGYESYAFPRHYVPAGASSLFRVRVHCCFTSTERPHGLLGTESPVRPPRFLHSC